MAGLELFALVDGGEVDGTERFDLSLELDELVVSVVRRHLAHVVVVQRFRGSDAVGAQKVGERVGRKLVQGAAGNPGDLRIGVLEHREERAYPVVCFQGKDAAGREATHLQRGLPGPEQREKLLGVRWPGDWQEEKPGASAAGRGEKQCQVADDLPLPA